MGKSLLLGAQNKLSYHIMGGNVAIASDGMSAISVVERDAAFQTCIPTRMRDGRYNLPDWFLNWEGSLREAFLPYVTNGTTFLGGTEYNHISADVVGPLKSNFSMPCPSEYTESQRTSECMSLQESVWGTEMLSRLEAVKREVDPTGLFNCYFCVGNQRMPSKPRSKDF